MARMASLARRAARARRIQPATRAATAVIDGVRKLDRGLRLVARDVERATGLSAAQLFVMTHLADAPAASLTDLAARTMTDPSSVSVVVDRLVTDGLVERITSAGDRRRSEVRLTRTGRRRLERAPSAPTDRLIAAVRRWAVRDVVRLGDLLRRLNADLGFEESGLLFQTDG